MVGSKAAPPLACRSARRAPLVVFAAALLALLVAGWAAWANRRSILESWWIHRLGSADLGARRDAARRLGEMGSKRAVLSIPAIAATESLRASQGLLNVQQLEFDAPVSIRAEAPTLAQLLDRTKPTATLNGVDMLWVEEESDGSLTVTLETAVLYRPNGPEAKFALLDEIAQEGPCALRFPRLTLPLMTEIPPPDNGGDLDYFVLLSRDQHYGRLYEIGWNSNRMGMHGVFTTRRLFLLKSAGGNWHLEPSPPLKKPLKKLDLGQSAAYFWREYGVIAREGR